MSLLCALALVGLFVAGGLFAVLDASRTRSALDAAARENLALKERREALQERLFGLGSELSALQDELAGGVGTRSAQAPLRAPAPR